MIMQSEFTVSLPLSWATQGDQEKESVNHAGTMSMILLCKNERKELTKYCSVATKQRLSEHDHQPKSNINFIAYVGRTKVAGKLFWYKTLSPSRL